jgi:hypothetical protein
MFCRELPRVGLELIQRQRRATAFEVVVDVLDRAGFWERPLGCVH